VVNIYFIVQGREREGGNREREREQQLTSSAVSGQGWAIVMNMFKYEGREPQGRFCHANIIVGADWELIGSLCLPHSSVEQLLTWLKQETRLVAVSSHYISYQLHLWAAIYYKSDCFLTIMAKQQRYQNWHTHALIFQLLQYIKKIIIILWKNLEDNRLKNIFLHILQTSWLLVKATCRPTAWCLSAQRWNYCDPTKCVIHIILNIT
jgi:hypothetical protein